MYSTRKYQILAQIHELHWFDAKFCYRFTYMMWIGGILKWFAHFILCIDEDSGGFQGNFAKV